MESRRTYSFSPAHLMVIRSLQSFQYCFQLTLGGKSFFPILFRLKWIKIHILIYLRQKPFHRFSFCENSFHRLHTLVILNKMSSPDKNENTSSQTSRSKSAITNEPTFYPVTYKALKPLFRKLQTWRVTQHHARDIVQLASFLWNWIKQWGPSTWHW